MCLSTAEVLCTRQQHRPSRNGPKQLVVAEIHHNNSVVEENSYTSNVDTDIETVTPQKCRCKPRRISSDKPHEERKKKMHITHKSVFKDTLLSLFDLPSEGDYILQQSDTEFSDWVDTDNPSECPNVGKLKITVCSGRLCFLPRNAKHN